MQHQPSNRVLAGSALAVFVALALFFGMLDFAQRLSSPQSPGMQTASISNR